MNSSRRALLRRAPLGVCLLAAVCGGPSHVAHAQSAEFRRAVEQGHRNRLRQFLPESTPLEVLLAEPEPESWPDRISMPQRESSELACRLAAQYALAEGDGQAAMRAATTCVESLDEGAASFEAQLLLTQGEFMAGRAEQAASRADWLSRHASEPWKGWGLFAQGECALAAGDTTEAIRLFKLCARMKGHGAAAPAHLELGRLYESRSQAESALHILTLYRESFPRGLVPVFESTSGASERADRAAGLEYSIQVGVYGDRANALRQMERFKAAGLKAELKARTISGQHYTAVWVGRYRTQNDAQDARRKLEARFDESYRVVVRE